MIREAALADRFGILRLGGEFVAQLGLLPFNAAYAERTVIDYVTRSDRFCLVLQRGERLVGFLMGHVTDHPFWPVKIASELAWWVEPAARGRGALDMVRAYEAWAARQGCALVGLAHRGDERLGRLYRRRGYALAESHFVKVL